MEQAIDWPLDLCVIRGGVENNTFGMVRRKADGSARAHQGWDFHAPIGTPCYAIADGKVEDVRSGGDYGLVLVLRFELEGRRLYPAYCHLSSTAVAKGDVVRKGQLVGKTGESGNAKGMKPADQHLHFEIRTTPSPGRGLEGRISPAEVFGVCPLKRAEKRGGVT